MVDLDQVLEDPRVVQLPEGYHWSRRIINYETVGRWCIVYDSPYAEAVLRPNDGEQWTRRFIESVLEETRDHILAAEERTQLRILEGPCAGNV